ALGCTRGNVTGLADRLRSLDLIRRTTNPDDRRCTLVELTEQGRQRLELARQAVSAFAAELQAGGPAAAWLGSIAEPGPTAAPSSAQSRPSSPEPGRAPRSRQVREAPAAYNTTVAAAEPVVTRGRGGEVVAVPGARDRVVVIRR
ncbi:MAG TPA: MarR family transcriptional regulator, partial [Bacillota bacterium]